MWHMQARILDVKIQGACGSRDSLLSQEPGKRLPGYGHRPVPTRYRTVASYDERVHGHACAPRPHDAQTPRNTGGEQQCTVLLLSFYVVSCAHPGSSWYKSRNNILVRVTNDSVRESGESERDAQNPSQTQITPEVHATGADTCPASKATHVID